jgi:hypothetical protein
MKRVLFGRLRGCNELRLFFGIGMFALFDLVRLQRDRDDWQRPLVCRLLGSPHGQLLGECLDYQYIYWQREILRVA